MKAWLYWIPSGHDCMGHPGDMDRDDLTDTASMHSLVCSGGAIHVLRACLPVSHMLVQPNLNEWLFQVTDFNVLLGGVRLYQKRVIPETCQIYGAPYHRVVRVKMCTGGAHKRCTQESCMQEHMCYDTVLCPLWL